MKTLAGADLAEDGLDIDGQVPVRTPEASDNTEAQALGAFLQTNAAGPLTPEEKDQINSHW